MLVDIVQTYDEHLFDEFDEFDKFDEGPVRISGGSVSEGPPGSTRPNEDKGHAMSTMAMAPALPKVTGRASVRAAGTDGRGLSDLSLTGRGRVVLWLLALTMVVMAVLVAGRAAADGPERAQQVESHVVQPGETMWQIASEIAGPGQDVRDVVFDLVRMNELPNAGLMAGQVIVVPLD